MVSPALLTVAQTGVMVWMTASAKQRIVSQLKRGTDGKRNQNNCHDFALAVTGSPWGIG
jgi:hypothetical protein